jgi:hypothetical protein
MKDEQAALIAEADEATEQQRPGQEERDEQATS